MPHRHMACPSGCSSLPFSCHPAGLCGPRVLVLSAPTRSLCSAGASLLPWGERASFTSPGAGRGHEHLQGWSRLRCRFSPASTALQMPPLPAHFGFCCRRIALPRNPTSSFSNRQQNVCQKPAGVEEKIGQTLTGCCERVQKPAKNRNASPAASPDSMRGEANCCHQQGTSSLNRSAGSNRAGSDSY